MPKINWRQILKTGLDVGQMFLPKAVSDAIDAVEENVETMIAGGASGWSGVEKQNAALSTLLNSVVIAEGIKGQDIYNDPLVLAAGRKAIDTAHAAKVAAAEFAETVKAFKAAKNPPAA